MTENIKQPTERTPLTQITWYGIGNKLLTGENYCWEALVDLEHELAPRLSHLSREEVILLVDFTQSGLPIVLTWEHPAGNGRVRITTATALISQLYVPDTTGSSPSIRVRHMAFEHSISLSDVKHVEQTAKSITFR